MIRSLASRRRARHARRFTGTSTPTTSAAAVYLLSDDAKNVTATTLYVDSGYSAIGM